MRFHVVAPGHVQTTSRASSCPFTMNAVKFCWMMKSLDHQVVLYSRGPGNSAPCDEHVAVGENLGRAIKELKRRLEPRDFICLFYGSEQQAIADAFPNHQVVEPAVGYRATCGRRRIFPSYAWMHTLYAVEQGSAPHPSFVDEVIPHQVFAWEHPFEAEPDDYYLFAGRDALDKGLHVAERTCEQLGARLLVIGEAKPTYGESRGVVEPEVRARLMGKAKALFAPTLYVEPFGLAVIEAMASGTPAITTDWGAFAETVAEGVSGYRCRMLADFVQAAEQAAELDRAEVRRIALARFSVEHVRDQYEAYFERLLTLWDSGWETLPAPSAAS
jgi:glycosyltransferase involved in cell wall biosynthesis